MRPTPSAELPGHVAQILPDIFQVQLPLPFALRAVNCYLIRGSQGWTLLDTGLNTRAGRTAWESACAALAIAPGAVAQILVSHIHPDHFGMAGWLQERLCGPDGPPPVRLSSRSLAQLVEVWAAPPAVDQAQVDFFRACGLEAGAAQAAMTDMGMLRAGVQPLPSRMEILAPGAWSRLGERDCLAIHAPGHSDGQIIFYDPADQIMLCADQVLMRISPNISIWPSTEPSPLRRYLASLAELAQVEVRLALPGHQALIHDWPGRLQEIAQHHAQRLEEMSAAIHSPSSVAQISQRLFDHDRLSSHEVRFAVTETLAHLCYLEEEGELIQETGADGVMRFGRG